MLILADGLAGTRGRKEKKNRHSLSSHCDCFTSPKSNQKCKVNAMVL